ncbi:flavodoxin reductase [Alkalitalea saponilacus]|uniref:Ferredoxin-NADP reductase n=2 Tax=Alkalitalea saponilacus TaxID=889453 RepID=A0A1T5FAW8_9BACT|nr:flavodoxin reductase [Alkalitalea saponilacus]SKB93300.1 Ferredoxin-NADP reductase [Alkalitalea saponilacus]
MDYLVEISSTEWINHDVLQIITSKPEGYAFIPGQATNIAINKPGLEEKSAPFTFTSTPDKPYLEFIIKIYADHNGFTNELQQVKPGDELKIGDPWGSIEYRGSGIFIAGGAGITPFISILRQLQEDRESEENKLIYANKTTKDIILKDELEKMPGLSVIHILSEENNSDYKHGIIDYNTVSSTISSKNQKIYLCGPGKMMESIENILKKLNIESDRIIKEEF